MTSCWAWKDGYKQVYVQNVGPAVFKYAGQRTGEIPHEARSHYSAIGQRPWWAELSNGVGQTAVEGPQPEWFPVDWRTRRRDVVTSSLAGSRVLEPATAMQTAHQAGLGQRARTRNSAVAERSALGAGKTRKRD
jgi:hypothetical protein